MFSRHQIARVSLTAATIAALSGTTTLARAEPAPSAEPAAPSPEPAPSAEPAASAASAPPSVEEDRVPASVAVLYPLATNANRPDVTTSFDLSLLYGRAGRIEGLQLGAVVTHASRQVEGAQIGGVAALGSGLSGVQLSGVANVSTKSAAGAQISGVANVVTGELTGAQIAPVNVAGPASGLQLGVVNVGKKVRGLQLGLVNIADEVDGGAIGLVSISKDSVHPIAWGSNLQYMNAGVKFTTRYLFTTLAAHYGTREGDFDAVGATLAIGGRVPLPERFDIEIQGSFTQLMSWSEKDKYNSWVAPQLATGYSFAKHLRVFAGGGVRLPVSVEIGREVTRPELIAGLQF